MQNVRTRRDWLSAELSAAEKLQPQNGEHRKKTHIEEPETEGGEMLAAYDFTGKQGVRGKYDQAYRQGHAMRIHQEDGTISLQYFTLEDGAVMLEPDVRAYFPDSEAVNTVLRSLIALVPSKHNANRRHRKLRTRPTGR